MQVNKQNAAVIIGVFALVFIGIFLVIFMRGTSNPPAKDPDAERIAM